MTEKSQTVITFSSTSSSKYDVLAAAA